MKKISSPKDFQLQLETVMDGIFNLMEMSREQGGDDKAFKENEPDKTCFELTNQFNRPSEYLESLLDIIRVSYEPALIGTVFLNSNLSFLYDAIPNKPFNFGYLSLTSEPGANLNQFWQEELEPHCKEIGYRLNNFDKVVLVVSTGSQRYGVDFVKETGDMLDANLDTDATNQVLFDGFCLDKSLDSKIRISLWLF